MEFLNPFSRGPVHKLFFNDSQNTIFFLNLAKMKKKYLLRVFKIKSYPSLRLIFYCKLLSLGSHNNVFIKKYKLSLSMAPSVYFYLIFLLWRFDSILVLWFFSSFMFCSRLFISTYSITNIFFSIRFGFTYNFNSGFKSASKAIITLFKTNLYI